MRELIKNFVKLISAMTLLIVIASSTFIIMFLNTATLKPLISEQIALLTGRNVVIDGGIHWSVFPDLAIHVSHLHFIESKYVNPTNVTDISNMTIGLRLLPLIYGKMEAADVTATIDTRSLTSDLVMRVLMDSQLTMNVKNKLYQFSNLTAQVQVKNKNKIVVLDLAGDVIADFKAQRLTWNNFSCRSEMGNFTGMLSMNDIVGLPTMSGQLNANIPDVLKLLNYFDQKVSVLQDARHVGGDIQFGYKHNRLDLTGNVQAERVILNNITMADLSTNFNYQNHTITINNIKAKTYGGELSGKGNINVGFDYPQIAFEGKLENVDSATIWSETVGDKHKIGLIGMGNISFNVNTVGYEKNKFVKNMSGTIDIDLSNGYLLGKDLVFLINHAYVPLNKNAVYPDKVSYSKLTGSMTIKNGLISNDDLMLEMPELVAKGKGQIDLQRHRVEYVLHTSVKNVKVQKIGNVELSNRGFVPIHIEGNVDDPKVFVRNNNV